MRTKKTLLLYILPILLISVSATALLLSLGETDEADRISDQPIQIVRKPVLFWPKDRVPKDYTSYFTDPAAPLFAFFDDGPLLSVNTIAKHYSPKIRINTHSSSDKILPTSSDDQNGISFFDYLTSATNTITDDALSNIPTTNDYLDNYYFLLASNNTSSTIETRTTRTSAEILLDEEGSPPANEETPPYEDDVPPFDGEAPPQNNEPPSDKEKPAPNIGDSLSGDDKDQPSATQIPEPGTFALFGLGITALTMLKKKKKR
jgi:PEP-CTERM motif